jgi:hypothetical protein
MKTIIKVRHQHLVIAFILSLGLTACSKQAWYQGAQSAQTANCMQEPLSEFEDCNKPSDENYQDFERKRKDLTEDTAK